MVDPVPARKIDNIANSALNDRSIFIKGDSDSTPSYEQMGGSEDVFFVRGGDSSFEFDRSAFYETLLDLKYQANVQVKDLHDDYTESFRGVVDALKLLYTVPSLYAIATEDIKKVFGDVKNIRPGSIGAFFIGCFNVDDSNLPLGCNPKCVSALPPAEGTVGYSNCEDLVLMYSDGQFSALNEKSSPHAYIYVDGKFDGFTEADKNKLKNQAHIDKVTLIFGDATGNYTEISTPISVDDLKVTDNPSQSLQVQQNSVTPAETTDNTSNNSSKGVAVAFTIIIILIIVLLIVIFYR
jgi:hypothetical protein